MRKTVIGAVIAAVYAVLTLLAFGFDLASGLIQVRFSEALCVLPAFSSAAVPGLFIGCLISNLVTGAPLFDIIFGSLATLMAALGSRLIATRVKRRFAWIFIPLPAVVINAVVVGLLLTEVYLVPVGYITAALSVGVGQMIACYGLGLPFYIAVSRSPIKKMLRDT